MSMNQDIGGKIREIRKGKRRSQAFVAQQLGVSRSQVTKWELGMYPISISVLVKIAKILNVGIKTILFTGRRDGQNKTS